MSYKPKFLRCFPSSGSVLASGYAEMDPLFAKQASRRFPDISYLLGQKIDESGNHVYIFNKYNIANFPVKENSSSPINIPLIKRSCRELVVKSRPFTKVLVGCPWCAVSKECSPGNCLDLIADDKYTIVHR